MVLSRRSTRSSDLVTAKSSTTNLTKKTSNTTVATRVSKRAASPDAAAPARLKRTRTDPEVDLEPAATTLRRSRSTTRKAATTSPTTATTASAAKLSRTKTAPAIPVSKAVEKPAKKPKAKSRSRARVPAAAGTADEEEPKPKPKTKSKSKPKEPVEPKPQRPYFNPLPKALKPVRPAAQAFVWGVGNFGQFGMGPDRLGEYDKPTRNKWVEEQIEDGVFGGEGAGIESVAAGGLHTVLIDEKGTIWSCGVNDDAALGRITKDIPDPSKPGEFIDIDTLTAIPHPIQNLVDEKFRAVKVVAGDNICAAISDEGELRVWGSFRANEGSLGYSDKSRLQYTPAAILDLKHKPDDVEKVVSVAAGDNHILAVTTHGDLYSWGAGEQGQLGRKVVVRRKISGTVPAKVVLGKRSSGTKKPARTVAVGAGAFTSFAVDEDGVLWAWGLNNLGQTGTGSKENEVSIPTKVVRLSKEELGGDAVVVAMEGGAHHSVFLTSDGRVYACGRADAGQIGVPKDHEALASRGEDGDHVREPVRVEFDEDAEEDPVVAISCGVHNNSAITKGGALYSWGQGTQGELGLKEEEVAWTPTVVVRREGGNWKALAMGCGGQHVWGLFQKK